MVVEKLVTSLAADAKKEFQKFACGVVRECKALFHNYNINSHIFDEFYMEYLNDSFQYRSFTHVLKMALTLYHGQFDLEHGFSLNKKLIVENISEESLIPQQFLKDHIPLNDYKPHYMPIAKELI